jgi:ribosomal-protein-alanine N-acetyltransferase
MACTSEELLHAVLAHARTTVEGAATALLAGAGAFTPRRGSWSAAQLLGHLVDSAQVNTLRLLRGLEREDLVFPGYDQDGWVRRLDPAGLPWDGLVEGWRADNLRLLRLAERADADERARPRTRHNLDSIGWQPHPAHLPASLEDLLRDYLGHLFHHLRVLSPGLVPPMAFPPSLGRAALPLETERLALRGFRDEDLDPLAAWLADPEVVRHLPGPPRSREQSARTLGFFMEHQERHGFSAWAMEERDTGRVLGWCGLAEFEQTGEVELLYCLGRGAWGRGLATEAARACVTCAREQVGLPRLIAAVVPENLASRAVLEKAGLCAWKPGRWFGLELDMFRVEFQPSA